MRSTGERPRPAVVSDRFVSLFADDSLISVPGSDFTEIPSPNAFRVGFMPGCIRT